mmetsp:Transcript_43231/g.90527  ORF Transcript_43231/g.90527 Transcript_43231/m.90527 type:complete len:232 (+) Transcript_43231:70-765(+)
MQQNLETGFSCGFIFPVLQALTSFASLVLPELDILGDSDRLRVAPFAQVENSPPKQMKQTGTSLIEFAFRKVHFRMLLHKLLQHILLLLLLACRQTKSFLPLIIHHLLNGLTRISVEIRKRAVFGLNLARIDLCISHHDTFPPFHSVHFFQGENHTVAILYCPKTVVGLHSLMQFSINEWLFPLHPNLECLLLDVNRQHFRFQLATRYTELLRRNDDLKVGKRLSPCISFC